MSESIRLRKLSFKSTMKFGKYYDLTVRNIIDLYQIKGLSYLTWCYYNNSNISFLPEVLDVLGIIDELQIDKPGKITHEEFLQYSTKAMKVRIQKEHDLDEQDLSKLKTQRKISINNQLFDDKHTKIANKIKDHLRSDRNKLRRKNQGH